MQGWSRMAALTLAALIFGAIGLAADAAETPAVKQKVNLSLRLDGLSSAGADIEIKPGNAACKFEKIKFQTKSHPKANDGKINLDPIEVECLDSVRDCSFVITMKEAGQSDKVVRRTLRLVPPVEGKVEKAPELTGYSSSNSHKPRVVAKPTEDSKRKK